MNYNYGLSIIKTSDPVFISDYENIIKKIQKDQPMAEIDFNYEDFRKASGNRLHMHGTIYNKRKIKFKKYFPKGYSWHINDNPPDAGWIKYCKKYEDKQTALINREHRLEAERHTQLTVPPHSTGNHHDKKILHVSDLSDNEFMEKLKRINLFRQDIEN